MGVDTIGRSRSLAEKTSGRTVAKLSRELDGAKAQSVSNDGDRAQGHRRTSDHGAEEDAEHRIENARCDWHRKRVKDESEEEILPDIAHHRTRQVTYPHDPYQITFEEGYARAIHRDVGARAHCDTDIRRSQRRR